MSRWLCEPDGTYPPWRERAGQDFALAPTGAEETAGVTMRCARVVASTRGSAVEVIVDRQRCRVQAYRLVCRWSDLAAWQDEQQVVARIDSGWRNLEDARVCALATQLAIAGQGAADAEPYWISGRPSGALVDRPEVAGNAQVTCSTLAGLTGQDPSWVERHSYLDGWRGDSRVLDTDAATSVLSRIRPFHAPALSDQVGNLVDRLFEHGRKWLARFHEHQDGHQDRGRDLATAVALLEQRTGVPLLDQQRRTLLDANAEHGLPVERAAVDAGGFLRLPADAAAMLGTGQIEVVTARGCVYLRPTGAD